VEIKTDDQSDDAPASTFFPARASREYVGEFKVTPAVHAGYAFTWFGLSSAGIIMTRKLLSRRK
jgi:cytochrome oxidase assembly protein ShyY1